VAAAPKAFSRSGKTTFLQAWQGFWFTAIPPLGLHALRVLASLLFLAWLLPFAGQVEALFGMQGWFDSEAYREASRWAEAPVPMWSLLWPAGIGMNGTVLHLVYWGTLAVFLLFTLGVATRVTAVLTWVLVVSFAANPATHFDADDLLGILAFYLMIGYLLLGQWSVHQSVWGRVFGTRATWLFGSGVPAATEPPSHAANLAIRLFQVHFALIVLTSALHKLQFGAWWSGTAFWYPLLSPLTTTEPQIRALSSIRDGFLFVLSVIQYAALAWQLCFPLFAWRPGRLRLVLFGGAVLGWLACWDFYQMPLFGPFYLIGCLSYLTPSEWLALHSRATRLMSRMRFRRALLLVFPAGLALLGAGCPPTDQTKSEVGSPMSDVKSGQTSDQTKSEVRSPMSDVVRTSNIEHRTSNVLCTRIDAALQEIRGRDLLRENSFWTVFHGILGVGPESAYLLDHRTGERVKALDYICQGGKIRGLEFVAIPPDRADVVTIPGSGTAQGHQDQFIAEMAQWGMPLNRKILVQGKEYTFEAFTRNSRDRASVKANQELSWAIIIIAQYYGTDITWTTNRGETLHFDDVVRYELHQPIKDSPVCGGTHRLFGLSWAYHLHLAKGGQKTGVWKEVEDLTFEYKELARKLQNIDGSFSTAYFRGPGNDLSNLTLRIHSTGHILEWLALALSDQELRQPWVENAADALAAMILNNRAQGLDSGAVYHATHGLEIYRHRVFGTPPPFIPLPPR